MIRVDDLSVSLGATAVLDDVSMAVDRGEFVGLVGPNGAGKTTLLRCLSGVLTPDSGVCTVDDDSIQTLSSREASRRIAVVPQDTTLQFDFTVRDVVAMGRTPHRGRFERATQADRDIVDDAMARTAVTDLAEKSIRAVSGGERQRVILSRALAQEAPVLLLDEPTASLDVNHQIRTMDLVADLVDDGRTAVAAIHDLSLAARFCDRLVLLADGAVVAAGPPERVLSRSTVAASFDADAAVVTDPVTDSPAVTPLSTPAWTTDARVHVLGSGTDAARAVTLLDSAGASVTAGPVPTGDVVQIVSEGVDVSCTTIPPYQRLDPATLDSISRSGSDADHVVLAGTVPPRALAAVPPGTRLLGTESATVAHGRPADPSGHGGDEVATGVTAPASGSTSLDPIPRIELEDSALALEETPTVERRAVLDADATRRTERQPTDFEDD